MVDESVHNNPQDLVERFVRLEAQVTNINHNMNLLMVSLASNLESFGDDGGSNLEIRSEGKSRDHEDPKKGSWKEYEKEISQVQVLLTLPSPYSR
jgi:hypothetical protein